VPESSQVPGAGRRPGYSYRLALVGLVASGLIVIAAFALPWASASVPLVSGLSGSLTEITFAGRELFALAAAMGWVGLAAVAGIFATRGWARVIIGMVVVGAGLVTIGSSIGFGFDPEPGVERCVVRPHRRCPGAVVEHPVVAARPYRWDWVGCGGCLDVG
jgi:hypothetical protein